MPHYNDLRDNFEDAIREPSENLKRQAAVKVVSLAIRQKWDADELSLVLMMLGLKEDGRKRKLIKANAQAKLLWSGDPRLR